MSPRILAPAVFALAFAVYANSLGNGFVWDDPIILTRQLPAFSSASAVLLPPANVPQFAPDYYRPLVIASYLSDRAFGSGAAWVFHLTVVAAHALAAVVVFALGLEIFRRRAGGTEARAAVSAAAAAALFAVHPVHTEAVAWIAGRADVFAGLFGTLALWAHLRSRWRPRQAWIAGAALLLALMAKEVAASLLLLLPAADWLLPADQGAVPQASSEARATRAERRRPGVRRARGGAGSAGRDLGRWLPIVAAAAVYAILRLSAVGHGVTTTSGEMEGSVAPALAGAIAVYAGKLVLPLSPNAYIAQVPQGATALGAGVLAAVALFAGLAWAWHRDRVLAFLLVWLLVTLLPSLTILFKIPAVPLAERYLYLPSVGFCLLVGHLGGALLDTRLAWVRRAAAALFCVALLAAAAATVRRNRAWASDLELWSRTAAVNPGVSMPLRSLGTALFRAGRLEEAEKAYDEALRLPNDDLGRLTLYNNLGGVAHARGDLDRAESFYRQSAALQPAPDPLYNIGVIHLERARRANATAERHRQARAALADLEKAEGLSPRDPDVQLALGEAFTLLDRSDEARERYLKALELGLAEPAAAEVRRRLDSTPEPQ